MGSDGCSRTSIWKVAGQGLNVESGSRAQGLGTLPLCGLMTKPSAQCRPAPTVPCSSPLGPGPPPVPPAQSLELCLSQRPQPPPARPPGLVSFSPSAQLPAVPATAPPEVPSSLTCINRLCCCPRPSSFHRNWQILGQADQVTPSWLRSAAPTQPSVTAPSLSSELVSAASSSDSRLCFRPGPVWPSVCILRGVFTLGHLSPS